MVVCRDVMGVGVVVGAMSGGPYLGKIVVNIGGMAF